MEIKVIKKEKPLVVKRVLSDRELLVLEGIVNDKTNGMIAKEHKLSEKTVGTYKKRLTIKLGLDTSVVHGSLAIAVAAVKEGYLRDDIFDNLLGK